MKYSASRDHRQVLLIFLENW